MPYVRRTVQAGPVREVKKMMTGRIHTKGAKRASKVEATSDKQAKVNERVAEEHLRWKINANYRRGDMHVVLHHTQKGLTLESYNAMLTVFFHTLRYTCKKEGLCLLYLTGTETKRMTNVHQHLLLKKLDPYIVAAAWNKATNGTGHITFTLLDGRGNHAKLANYLIKETRSTMRRYAEMGRRCKRFSCSKGMVMPEARYEVVKQARWRDVEKPKKGMILFKFEDGATQRTGWHESGYPWQEYFEIDYDST